MINLKQTAHDLTLNATTTILASAIVGPSFVYKQILAALETVRRDTLRQAWHVARDGCLVLPDGGSPTEDEAALCNHIADGIQRLIPGVNISD